MVSMIINWEFKIDSVNRGESPPLLPSPFSSLVPFLEQHGCSSKRSFCSVATGELVCLLWDSTANHGGAAHSLCSANQNTGRQWLRAHLFLLRLGWGKKGCQRGLDPTPPLKDAHVFLLFQEALQPAPAITSGSSQLRALAIWQVFPHLHVCCWHITGVAALVSTCMCFVGTP